MAGLLGAASALTSRAPRIVHAGRRSEAANCSICAMCARDATRARATEPALGAWIQTLDITPPTFDYSAKTALPSGATSV